MNTSGYLGKRAINTGMIPFVICIAMLFAGCGAASMPAARSPSNAGAGAAVSDTTAPVTTATIDSPISTPLGAATATLTSPMAVTLLCADGGTGSGCLATYFTIDGTTPTRASTMYSGPIAIFSGTTLKYFSIDKAGNSEPVQTRIYAIGSIVIKNIKSVSAGWNHTIGIKTDGTLWAWGGNSSGQLGLGTLVDGKTPVQAGTDTHWAAAFAGTFFTVALKSDGTLWSWGSNTNGQLGDGTNANRSAPVQVGTGANWKAVAVGSTHVLAIKGDGTLWAWGGNALGQLGLGTTAGGNAPAKVGTDTNWTAVAAGAFFSVALKNDGTIWEWGDNRFAQLGHLPGTNFDLGTSAAGFYNTAPVQSPGTNWSIISAGSNHTVALKSDGTLWAWGQNWYGQLGDGTTITKAWAGDGTHQLNPMVTFDVAYPIKIGTDTDWIAISAGAGHTVGLKSDGRIWAWGLNVNGQLGDGTTMDNLYPLPATAESFYPLILPQYPWSLISAGRHHTAALRSDGTLWAWGWNGSGQLGDGKSISTGGGSDAANPTWKIPKFAYVVSDKVYSYTLDYTTGLLATANAPVTAGTNPTLAVIHPSGNFLYVVDTGDGTSAGKIHTFPINRTTGALTTAGSTVDTLLGAASITIDPLGRFAYVIGGNMKGWNMGEIAVYTIDPVSGALNCVGNALTHGAATMAIEPLGRFAYVVINTLANGTSIYAYTINQATGMLDGGGDNDRDPEDVQVLVGSTTNLAAEPSGQYLYVMANGGTYTSTDVWGNTTTTSAAAVIKVFAINQTSGNIFDTGFTQGETSASTMAPGSSGYYSYMLFGGNLNVLVINQLTGQITDGGMDLAPTGAVGAATEPTGKFVYAFTPGYVEGYALDPRHGTTMPIGPTGSPTHMAADAGASILHSLVIASY